MGIHSFGITIAEDAARCIKASVNKGITKPSFSFFTSTERGFANFTGDAVSLTKNKFLKPTEAKLKEMMTSTGIKRADRIFTPTGQIAHLGAQDVKIINENNSIFMEELMRLFPNKAEQQVNTAVQKRMLYLQNIEHSKFQDKQKFLEQFLKDVEEVENITANEGGKLYNDTVLHLYAKKSILQAKYNNPERYKELMDLISLYKKGLVPKHNVLTFFPEGHFHPLIKADMQKLLNGEHYFPILTELSEKEINKIPFGEVFSVGEKMFVKTKNGYEALKFDKTTYEKLFPPIERYSISQNDYVGNCGKIASWNGMIKNPNSRIKLYQMFEQTPQGVKVSIPSINYSKEFDFNNLGEIYSEKSLQGSIGHRMLEYTYDFGKFGRIDAGGNPRPQLITNITGLKETKKYFDTFLTWRQDKALKESFIAQETDGIYVKNCGYDDLNRGMADAHFYSTTDLTSGKWQNPWTGVEELTHAKELCVSGSVHSYSKHWY